MKKDDGAFYERAKAGKSRLIINYSIKRAKKDPYDREKGVRRLQNEYKTGKITKENINKREYNKFLEITENIEVRIDQEKIALDALWDGLKGYITNTELPAKEVYEQYNGLWTIEKSFRITKGTLEMRQMFHFTPKRIEAHVCICFVAYKIYKELDRILKISNIGLSVDKVLSIAKTVTTLKIRLLLSSQVLTKTMILSKQHKKIEQLFNPDFWNNF